MNNFKTTYKNRKWMFIPFFIMGMAGLTSVVMYLWNALIPDIFHATTISFWQAAGLLVLSKILFGSFNFKPKHQMNQAFKVKLMNMSEEERQQFKEQWKQRCGNNRFES